MGEPMKGPPDRADLSVPDQRSLPGPRVLIANNQALFSEILAKACAAEGLWVVAAVHDPSGLIAAVQRHRPSVALMEVRLGGASSFPLIAQLRDSDPDLAVIVFTEDCTPYSVYCTERAKAQGFVDRGACSFSEVVAAIRAVHAKKTYFSPNYLQLRDARLRDGASFDRLLSLAEEEILVQVSAGWNDEQIGEYRNIKPPSVAKQRSLISQKLKVRIQDLAAWGKAQGFHIASTIPPSPATPR